jgi:putative Mn2+ efflux pump MntP
LARSVPRRNTDAAPSNRPARASPTLGWVAAKLIALILPLGLDTFAVASALGAIGRSRSRLRISLLFTAFEAGMPLVGLALGAPLGHAIGSTADYLAIGLLVAFGLFTLLTSEAGEQDRVAKLTQVHGVGALLLGMSISLDELAIGFTLGLLRLPAGLVVLLIALQAFVVTQLGLRLGSRLSDRMREGAERLAGLTLTALGLVLLAEKLLA